MYRRLQSKGAYDINSYSTGRRDQHHWRKRQGDRLAERGAIDQSPPPILQRPNIDKNAWTEAMRPKGNVFGRAMGNLNHLKIHARALGQSWIKGLRQANSIRQLNRELTQFNALKRVPALVSLYQGTET